MRSKKYQGYISLIIMIVIAVFAAIGWFYLVPSSRTKEDVEARKTLKERQLPDLEKPIATNLETMNSQELKIEILRAGAGVVAKAGDQVTVHYTGWLTSGSKFDSSVDRGEPFTFLLGAGQVIQGWDQGVSHMKVGEKRKLIIPPQLGYGPSGTPGGPIPPNATLIFEVELLKIN